MEYAVDTRNKKIRDLFEAILPSMIEQLGLQNSKRAVLIKVAKDIPDNFEGATLNIKDADCMLVLIRAPKKVTESSLLTIALTLAHEMVHVRQLAKGIMQLLPKDARMWRGKIYNKKVKYLDQPWELDAFARQEIILRRAIA